MVKDAGLACKIIIAKEPVDCPVTERFIDVQIQTRFAENYHFFS